MNIEEIKEVTGEYLYNKGFINGLKNAIGKSEIEINALIDVYKVNTIKIDKMLERKNKDD